ncbi:hypothetical protein [Roseobacter sp.]|uniref:hypothetical protein n=1 Tax=Roseobacter sp. TaxID=1907202 RepID=UPI002966FCFC|nr:hypothetical protein [Roseobacter sp.]MDW3181797.1 hypothetical protein [Roseobacter sp.]
MCRLKTSTSLVLLLAAIPSFSAAHSSPTGLDVPQATQRLQNDRNLLRVRLETAAAKLPDASDDLSVAQWNNWSNWSNLWNNWNNWANW